MNGSAITNIQEANQRIGELNAHLSTEKEARTAAQSDLETAKAAHAEEVDQLKIDHKAELEKARGEHATKVTELTDQIEAKDKEIGDLKAKVDGLEGEAATGDDKAAKIIAQVGGEAVGTDSSDSTSDTPLTESEEKALWDERAKLGSSAEKRDFYLKNIKPRLANKAK